MEVPALDKQSFAWQNLRLYMTMHLSLLRNDWEQSNHTKDKVFTTRA
jgi:hypothetical protein